MALTTAELSDMLELPSMPQRRWHIQASCASTGEGLSEGMDWLCTQLVKPICW
jgi:ADP-ribosylation factor protein 1